MMSSLYVLQSQVRPRIKTCADCKHYVNNTQKCSKFVYMNVVTAEKVYLDASVMRTDPSLCGMGAIHYEYDPNKKEYLKS